MSSELVPSLVNLVMLINIPLLLTIFSNNEIFQPIDKLRIKMVDTMYNYKVS